MGDAVAEAVMAQWAALPKTGKPQPHEHTVLAGIALELPAAGSSNGSSSSSDGPAAAGASGAAGQVLQGPQQAQQQQQVQLAVVAIATGTKCLGGSKRVPGGAAVNDCHAEALSRRALLRWLYGEMQQAAERCAAAAAGGASPAEAAAAASTAVLRLVPPTDGAAERLAASSAGLPSSADLGSPAGAAESAAPPTTDLFGGWRFQLQPGVRLHMYVSQPPCGDASILHAEGAKVAEGAVGAACQHGSAVCRSSGADAPAGAEADGQKAAADAAGAAAAAAGGRGLAASFGRTGAKPLLKRQRLQPAMDEQLGGQPQPSGSAEAGQLTQQAQDAQPAAVHQEQWRLPQQHEVESYGAAQETGVVRRKPGRGDATLSMSCSDKLARWLLLGLQGSLLDGLLAAPLHLASVTVNLPPPPAGTGQAAAAEAGDGRTSSRQDLAAQAAAALHRALVERTAVLAAERLPPARQPAAPALHIHSPAAAADEQAAGSGGGSSSSSGGSRMQALGLAPSASRRVAGGSSVVWVAPPLAGFKWKQQQLPADGSLAATAVAGSPAHSGTRSTTVPVLAGGATEAVAGGNGLKVGAAKVKPGQPVPPSAQPSVCKAALFRQWAQLAAALRSLLGSGKQAEALQAGQQPSSAADAAGEAAANAPAPVAAAYAGYSAVQSLSYRAAKRAAGGAYTAGWQALLAPPSPFEAWIPKPPELEEFAL